MASSDDEELGPESVTNYYFLEGKEEEPISFAVLPVLFDDAEEPAAMEEQVFLKGQADGGLQPFYKQVTAWKLGLEDDLPEIFVLSKDKKWIKLLKPRKSYEVCIRTILITVKLLHILRRDPESSEKSLWQHLRKVFSSFEDVPSVNDLTNHYPLMQMFVERDNALSKSQLLSTLLTEKSTKKFFSEDIQNDSDVKKPFIVDDYADDGMMEDDDGNESEEESDLFDSVCAICDNGGELLCCEGRCMRSFHATRTAGLDSECKSLGFTKAQVEAIQNFLCKNCEFKRHQCFACGKLGSSDKSAGPEVFQCANATCGYFYHPKCASDILFPDNETEALECQKNIADGQSFTCPVHKCIVCKQGENKECEDLQFAICRRCPKTYHRKCLPRKISFDDIEDEDILQRAWDDLLPNRILIYCLKHKIDEDLGTPIRNHIIFPEDPEKKKALDAQKRKQPVPMKKKHMVSVDSMRNRASIKPVKATEEHSSSEESHPVVRTGTSVMDQVLNFQKQLKPSKYTVQSDKRKADGSSLIDNKKAPKDSNKTSVPTGAQASKGKSYMSSQPNIDSETEKKIFSLVQKASSSLTLEDIVKKRTIASTYAYTSRNIDKSVTMGKLERTVEAMRTALQKLEANGSIEDAKAVCEPDILRQLQRWHNKLKVYLAPFLHGTRYTSYGRHFTKEEKLKEIAEKLQWYVQDGDMIVDFCCGANDFSLLMKETLDASGKKCSFKNFDLLQPKNDFNFEMRDWMTVQPHELPNGKQLIMGLNPPFGVKAALANRFVDKALTFKPKLIILIVPPETERLDRKNPPYDLIWEDGQSLSGKSFYLPGSFDCNDKQMDQWNVTPPPLYLWSRRDWTSKHKVIASEKGHISKNGEQDTKDEVRAKSTRDEAVNPAEIRREREDGENSKRRNAPVMESVEERCVKREPQETRRERDDNGENSEKRNPEEPRKVRDSNGESRKNRNLDETRRECESNAENSRKRDPRVVEKRVDVNREETRGERSNDGEKVKKRNPPEGNKSRSPKKRKTRRKQQEGSERRNDVEKLKNDPVLSDMSISPPRLQESRMARTSAEVPNNQRSKLDFEPISRGMSAANGRESIDDTAMRYPSLPVRDGSYNWSNNEIGGHNLGNRRSEDRFAGGNNPDSFGRSYGDGYGAPLDADRGVQQAWPYSLQANAHEDPLLRNRYSLGGFDSVPGRTSLYSPSPSYGLPGSAAGSSAMDRYAPRLDETNYHVGPGNPGAGGPPYGSGGSVYDVHGAMRGTPPDPYFAPGSRHL